MLCINSGQTYINLPVYKYTNIMKLYNSYFKETLNFQFKFYFLFACNISDPSSYEFIIIQARSMQIAKLIAPASAN